MGTKPSKSKSPKGGASPSKSSSSSPTGNSSSKTSVSSPPGKIPSKKDEKSPKKQSKKDKDPAMPLFGHKQSDAGRKRQQHKVYLAQESPEATVDVSDCESVTVPSGIYSICKVLQKEALLLHTNWLTSLKGGGNILDLTTIRVLDLHSNLLTSLPDEICQLRLLQVLNVEKNKLTQLPANIGNLEALQNLNLRGNRLRDLPASITKLRSLRSLELMDNQVTHLPKNLCHVRTLDTLLVDVDTMAYPNSEICSQGTESIMKHLCSDCGIEYITPSSVVLDVLEPPKVTSPSMVTNALRAVAEDVRLMTSFDQYAAQKEKKRLERIDIQREFETHQLQQAELAAMSAAGKQELVNMLAEDEEKVFQELNYLTQRKERDRINLVASIHEVELRAADLMNQLLKMNEKARKTEELHDQMERERIEQEELFIVRQEETEILRKQDVLIAMERVLEDNKNFDLLWKDYEADRRKYTQKAMETESETNDQVNSALKVKRFEQQELLAILCKQEKLQKEAFESLQLQRDARHARLTSEIDLIQDELARLTRVEMDRREERKETGKTILSENRLALTRMMMQLLDERDNRAVQLKQRMREMERRREDGQMDYWLVQYQRLMDKKPQELIDQEKQLEIAVLKILEQANAAEYIPLFSRHRITIETMLQLTEDEIKQMGVHQMGLRKSIFRGIQEYMAKEGAPGSKKLEEIFRPPTAPSRTDLETPKDIKARGVDSECCICMERKSAVVFLACGHVCTCDICSSTVTECPLCRAVIEHRITLFS